VEKANRKLVFAHLVVGRLQSRHRVGTPSWPTSCGPNRRCELALGARIHKAKSATFV